MGRTAGQELRRSQSSRASPTYCPDQAGAQGGAGAVRELSPRLQAPRPDRSSAQWAGPCRGPAWLFRALSPQATPRCLAPGLGLQPLSCTLQSPLGLLHGRAPSALATCRGSPRKLAEGTDQWSEYLVPRVWVDSGMNRFPWRLSKAGLGTLSRALLFLGQSSPLLQPGQCCAPIAEDLESHTHECLCPSGFGLGAGTAPTTNLPGIWISHFSFFFLFIRNSSDHLRWGTSHAQGFRSAEVTDPLSIWDQGATHRRPSTSAHPAGSPNHREAGRPWRA